MSQKYERPKYECECAYCNNKCYKTTNEIKRSKHVYCSRQCYHNHRGLLDRKPKVDCICEYCGTEFQKQPSKVKNRANLYCSIKCKDIHNGLLNRGENHFRYNPNFDRTKGRKYQEYYHWRNEIYIRDNYTCQCCGDNKGGNLVAHHIYNYSEYENYQTVVDNGVSLCKDCHKTFHDSYGYTNNNIQQLIVFFNMPINYQSNKKLLEGLETRLNNLREKTLI